MRLLPISFPFLDSKFGFAGSVGLVKAIACDYESIAQHTHLSEQAQNRRTFEDGRPGRGARFAGIAERCNGRPHVAQGTGHIGANPAPAGGMEAKPRKPFLCLR